MKNGHPRYLYAALILVRMGKKSMWSTVGVVDRRDQHKPIICSPCGQCCLFPSQFLPFLIVWTPLQLTQVPISPDRAVFVQQRQRQTDKLITLLLAHAQACSICLLHTFQDSLSTKRVQQYERHSLRCHIKRTNLTTKIYQTTFTDQAQPSLSTSGDFWSHYCHNIAVVDKFHNDLYRNLHTFYPNNFVCSTMQLYYHLWCNMKKPSYYS